MDDKTITRYLLGASSSEEQKQIEERYFSDPGVLDQLLAIEDDLVDAYARHELTGPERKQFETHFLASPERRERVETAEALLTHLAESRVFDPSPATEKRQWRRSWSGLLRTEGLAMRVAFTAVVLVAVVGALWLFIENRRLRAQLDQAQVEKTGLQQQEQQLQQQLNAGKAENKQLWQEHEKSAGGTAAQKPNVDVPSPSAPAIASFVLTPGLTRDVEEMNKLVVPGGATFVRLQLSIESRGEYKNYRASLQRVGAGEIWSHAFQKSRLGASKDALAIKLPANLFTSGDYLLTLTGITETGEAEAAGEYTFTLVRQSK